MKNRILFLGPMLGRHANLVPNPAEELSSRLQERGYTCLLSSSVANRYLRFFDMLWAIINNVHKVDGISLQTYSGPSFIVEDALSWLAGKLEIRIVMVLHGGSMPEFMQRFPNWSRRVLARAYHIVTPSGYLADTISQYGFRAVVIQNAINLADYPCRFRMNAQPRLLWMRTFHEIYNPEMAIETLGQLVPDYPNVTLTMAGQEKGSLKNVKKLVQEKHLEPHVRFAGFLNASDKQREFLQHDIFINTNRVDNMPISLVEASAFGMPIVATSVGGVPYLIRDGENGLLVPNEDASAMAQSVRHLIEEPGLAERLSKNARKFAETHDWSVVLPMWESLFQEVMG